MSMTLNLCQNISAGGPPGPFTASLSGHWIILLEGKLAHSLTLFVAMHRNTQPRLFEQRESNWQPLPMIRTVYLYRHNESFSIVKKIIKE